MADRKGLWCPSCQNGIFTVSPVALTVAETGVVFTLEAVKAVTCVSCGAKWAWDGSVPGTSKIVSLISTEAKRMIGDARAKEWDAYINPRDLIAEGLAAEAASINALRIPCQEDNIGNK